MKPQYKPKTIAQKLGYLVEECEEVLAAVGKTQRRGLLSVNPELIGSAPETNEDWILRETEDLKRAIFMVRRAIRDTQRKRQKSQQVKRDKKIH